MNEMQVLSFDAVVLGGGSAGLAAAIAAARRGLKVALVEAGPAVGGELLSGIPIDGAITARGDWVTGGPTRELLEECATFDGYLGEVNDWRLIRYACFDPEAMRLAAPIVLARHGVRVFLHLMAVEAAVSGGRVRGLVCAGRGGRVLLEASVFLDCSGDAELTRLAGGEVETVPAAELQPVSLMFRVAGVDATALLDFAVAHPENLAVGESPWLRGSRTDRELAEELRRQAQPAVFFKSDGPLLGDAIRAGEMYPTALLMLTPTSAARREVTVNSTRIAGLDASGMDAETGAPALGRANAVLAEQVRQCLAFLRARVPGFAQALFNGAAPRLGIRETRRIVGEERLTQEDVLAGRKRADGVAKGCHHVDIHGAGTEQVRIPIPDGGSYDIPYGALLPRGLDNVAVAGRCLSADRPAQGTARVMGGCMAMGHAIGAAAALWMEGNARGPLRDVPVGRLRDTIRAGGGVVDGIP
jgi:hypothetical protein